MEEVVLIHDDQQNLNCHYEDSQDHPFPIFHTLVHAQNASYEEHHRPRKPDNQQDRLHKRRVDKQDCSNGDEDRHTVSIHTD